MGKTVRRVSYAALAGILVVAVFALDFLWHGGQFTGLIEASPGPCTKLELGASSEDIAVDRPRGLAYLSYLDRRAQVEGKDVLGTVMLMDLNASTPRPRAALVADPPDFRPHGMSLFAPAGSPARLFVVSHPPGGRHTVEIFEQGTTGGFSPLETIRDPLLVRPNAVAAIGPRQFYVVNDSGASGGLGRVTEMLFRRALATLVYFDGKSMRVVAHDIAAGSGLAASTDGTQLYVSEMLAKRVSVFARDATSGDVRLERTIDLPATPDNINVDADGHPWIAAHPRTLALMRHFGDANRPSPTQVYEVSPTDWVPRLRYSNDGTELSAGSVAVVNGKRLLIGSITAHAVLSCTLPD